MSRYRRELGDRLLALRLAAAGEPYAWYAVVGLVVNIAVLWLLLRRFNTILHR